jgi:hypothetical protein
MDLLQAIYAGDPCTALDEAVRGVAATRGLDEETIRQLRALGYLR